MDCRLYRAQLHDGTRRCSFGFAKLLSEGRMRAIQGQKKRFPLTVGWVYIWIPKILGVKIVEYTGGNRGIQNGNPGL
jgi:hypothetical protein